jgi:hypothetical protein
MQEERNLGREEFRKLVEEISQEVFTPTELAKLTGKSNAAYHYLGSAKFMARAGQAFAQAMHDLQYR